MSMEAIPVFERKLTIFYPIATDMRKKIPHFRIGNREYAF